MLGWLLPQVALLRVISTPVHTNICLTILTPKPWLNLKKSPRMMWCSRCDCSFLNQKFWVQILSIEKSLTGKMEKSSISSLFSLQEILVLS